MLRIGFAPCFFHADPQRAIFKGKTLLYMEQSMSHWIMAAGALPCLIPQPASPGSAWTVPRLVEDLDGLLLQGGSDVSPESYGETALKPEWAGDRKRDLFEMDLIHEFIHQKKPILGICRGLQILNVALGGTLYQDITLQCPESLVHRDWNIYDQNFHELEIKPGSWLEKWKITQSCRTVNTIHHQAIKGLASDLMVEAISPRDQIIEAVRHRSCDFVYAIQWHPEFHPKTGVVLDAPILQSFLEKAQQRKKTQA